MAFTERVCNPTKTHTYAQANTHSHARVYSHMAHWWKIGAEKKENEGAWFTEPHGAVQIITTIYFSFVGEITKKYIKHKFRNFIIWRELLCCNYYMNQLHVQRAKDEEELPDHRKPKLHTEAYVSVLRQRLKSY